MGGEEVRASGLPLGQRLEHLEPVWYPGPGIFLWPWAGLLALCRIDRFRSGRDSALCRTCCYVSNLLGRRSGILRRILIFVLGSGFALQLLLLGLQGSALSWLFNLVYGLLCALGCLPFSLWYCLF